MGGVGVETSRGQELLSSIRGAALGSLLSASAFSSVKWSWDI